MSELLTKSEASIYILGYEDRKFINQLLSSGKLGVILLGSKTKKIISRKDIDRLLEREPRYRG